MSNLATMLNMNGTIIRVQTINYVNLHNHRPIALASTYILSISITSSAIHIYTNIRQGTTYTQTTWASRYLSSISLMYRVFQSVYYLELECLRAPTDCRVKGHFSPNEAG